MLGQWHFFLLSAWALNHLAGSDDADSRTTCEIGREEVLVRGPPVGLDSTESHHGSSRLGRFHSPKPYGDGRFATRCVYRFVANVGEKVHIKFDRFQLTGLMPRCTEAFLDVYIDVASSALDVDRENAVLSHLASGGEQRTTTPFSAAVYSAVLDRSVLLGRFCGSGSNETALQFVSLHHEIVLDFYSETGGPRIDYYQHGFSGTYEFINDAPFYPGRSLSPTELPLPWTSTSSPGCRFVIDAKREKDQRMSGLLTTDVSGELISPTYPGLHPDGMVCAYQLVGLPTQRVALTIEELHLSQSQKGCFLDFLVFYDVATDGSNPKLIGERFCGKRDKLEVVSTGSNLLIAFVTGEGDIANSDVRLRQRRGFRLRYTFSESIMPIEEQYAAQHIRGTECDYLIMNRGYKEAVFESPGYNSGAPLLPGKSCSTFFVGARKDDLMESVRLRFDEIVLSNRSWKSQSCDQGSIEIYGIRSIGSVYQLNEPIFRQPMDIYGSGLQLDVTLCNSNPWITSGKSADTAGPVPLIGRQSVVKISQQAPVSLKSAVKIGYRATYHFVKDFGVPGLAMSTKYCHFLYSGHSPGGNLEQAETTQVYSSGWTNSPHFPFAPPRNITCTYLFTASLSGVNDHVIRLFFSHFDLFHGQSGPEQTRLINESSVTCGMDFVEFVELVHPLTQQGVYHIFDASENSDVPFYGFSGQNNSAISATAAQRTGLQIRSSRLYCGDRIPGPFISSPNVSGILVRHRSSSKSHSLTFALRYEFIDETDNRGSINRCGDKVQSVGGIIETPNYPHSQPANLSCIWTLQAENPASHIQLHFEQFSLVGDSKNCSQALTLIYPDTSFQPTHHLCGQQTSMPAIVITSSLVRVQLITIGKRSSDSRNGFRLIWTELLRNAEENVCYEFQCISTKRCISKLLKCNGISNCGTTQTENGETVLDNSDEADHCSKSVAYSPVHIGIGVLLTILLLLAVVAFIYLRERGRRLKQPADPLAQLGISKHSLTSAHSGNTKSVPVCLNDTLLPCPVSIPCARKSESAKKVPGGGQFPQTTSRDFVGRQERSSTLQSHYQHAQQRHTCAKHPSGRNGILQAQNRSCEHLAGKNKSAHSHSGRTIPPKHRVVIGRLPPHSRCISSLPRDASGRRGTQLTPSGSLSADVDGGLLIREKMQKISIV